MTEPSLTSIIQKMLFGMGDCKQPNKDSCTIIEYHLQQQLDFIVYEAHSSSGNPDIEEITVANILFLMRNNPVRLQRAYQYFDLKSRKQEITGGISGAAATVEDIESNLKNYFAGKKKSRGPNIKQQIEKFLKDFNIEIGSEYVDESRRERLLRLSEQTMEHTTEDYLLFQQSRSISFESTSNKNLFDEWLQIKLKANPGVALLTSTSYELLHFLAKEIIAQMIDHALSMRKSAQAQTLSGSDLNSKNQTKQVESPPVYPIMPEEVNEVMRRCQYSYNKPFQNVSYCIIF